jgi:hypothetical protein
VTLIASILQDRMTDTRNENYAICLECRPLSVAHGQCQEPLYRTIYSTTCTFSRAVMITDSGANTQTVESARKIAIAIFFKRFQKFQLVKYDMKNSILCLLPLSFIIINYLFKITDVYGLQNLAFKLQVK